MQTDRSRRFHQLLAKCGTITDIFGQKVEAVVRRTWQRKQQFQRNLIPVELPWKAPKDLSLFAEMKCLL